MPYQIALLAHTVNYSRSRRAPIKTVVNPDVAGWLASLKLEVSLSGIRNFARLLVCLGPDR